GIHSQDLQGRGHVLRTVGVCAQGGPEPEQEGEDAPPGGDPAPPPRSGSYGPECEEVIPYQHWRITMNVFVAGASGAIGRPLVAELVRRGHTVTGMTNSDAGARALADLGAAVARVNVFDATGVEEALRRSRAEVVIDELTSLPRSPSGMAEA